MIHPPPPPDPSPPPSALPTPADIAAEDPPEEEFRHRRQNALHGLGLHQRYLRSSAQKPPEEEEEHGPQSLAPTRGRLRFRECSRDKLQLIVRFVWVCACVCARVCETGRCKTRRREAFIRPALYPRCVNDRVVGRGGVRGHPLFSQTGSGSRAQKPSNYEQSAAAECFIRTLCAPESRNL